MALAKELGRDYKNVHGDVTALVEAGLLDRDDATGALSTDYDRVKVELEVVF